MPMTKKERIFHAVFFEFLLLILMLLALKWFTDHRLSDLLLVIVSISVMAVVWNFIFNFIFDKFFTAPRETRSFGVRVFHTLAFELVLLAMTLPLVAYLLDIGLWAAFVMDISMTLSVMVYAFCFNWAYDVLRLKFFAWQDRRMLSL